MAKIDTDIINWNKAPYSPDNRISKEVRNALCKRFEVAIANLRDNNRYNELLLTDGWVITAKDNIVFVLNPIKDENITDNVDLKGATLDAGKLGAQLRKARDSAFDLEKYSELSAVKDLTMDANTGKITYKVV